MKPGRPRKKKGRGFEVEIVKSVLEAFPSLQEADVTARVMSDSGMDILLSPAARLALPLAIEAKRVGKVERLNLKAAMAQAEANVEPGLVPVVVYREDHHEALAALRLGGLVALLQVKENDLPHELVTLKWTDLLKLLARGLPNARQ